MKPLVLFSFLFLFQLGAARALEAPARLEILCITPDGRVSTVPAAMERQPGHDAVLLRDDTLSCDLREGQTSFIIKVTDPAVLERLQLRSEDATAAGSLSIAVSDEALPAQSPKWIEVEGDIAFQQKRHFRLSMLGVAARYVKLEFRVAKSERVAALDL